MSGYIDFVNLGGTRKDLRDIRGDELALIDGYYEGMTVGDAEQLVATVGVQDKVPYLFRTSGGSIDIGDREVDKIVGASFPWNQLDSGYSYTANSGNKTHNLPADSFIAKGHKIFMSAKRSSGSIEQSKQLYLFFREDETNDSINLVFYASDTSLTAYKIGIAPCDGKGGHSNSNGDAWIYHTELPFDVSDLQIIDLTQLFGSTIADYIYSLETGTPGAGVAWFRKLFPKLYYAYNAGSMESVCANLHKMTGFNQWDEQWELGYLSNTDGSKVASNAQVRSKNYIPVAPNTTYYCKAPVSVYMYYYDANKQFISYEGTNVTGRTFTTPSNAYYLLFYYTGTTYANDICINLHWDGERDGEYEPYVAHSYDLDPVVLRGIPYLDSGNKLAYNGDVYNSDGTVERRFKELVLDGSNQTGITYGYGDNPYKYISIILDNEIVPSVQNITVDTNPNKARCDRLSLYKYSNDTGHPDTYYLGGTSSNRIFYLRELTGFTGTSTADAKAYLAEHPVTIVYELDTPTTEQANPYQTPQIVDDWGTEEYVDALATAQTSPRDVAIPVGHDTTYRNNLRAKLEMAPESPSGDGDYIVRQTSGQNEYVALEKELPTLPTEDGTYTLKCTVSGSTKTLTWESDTE